MKLNKRRLDYRTRLGKLVTQMHRSLVNDLGGEQAVTTAQRILVDRIIIKVAMIGFQEQAYLRGESRDFKDYLGLTNSLRSDLALLGLQRREKDCLTLTDYLNDLNRSDKR